MAAPATFHLNGYLQELPNEMIPAACQSGLYSFTIGLLLTGCKNFSLGLFNGTVALLSSAIDSLVQPIFNRIFTEEGSWSHLFARTITVLSVIGFCASGLAGALGSTMMVNVAVSFILTQIYNGFFGTGEPNTADPYIVV